tara:strand:- start:530 stop:748 length:219 start_codon:yes stop_codon:yes gene_type:complete
MTEKCEICKYFRDSQIMGSCRRYPVLQNKHANDWCGEFASVVAIIREEDVSPAPVAGSFSPKKRGRPAKEAK